MHTSASSGLPVETYPYRAATTGSTSATYIRSPFFSGSRWPAFFSSTIDLRCARSAFCWNSALRTVRAASSGLA